MPTPVQRSRGRRPVTILAATLLLTAAGALTAAPAPEGSELGTLASYRRALAAVERAVTALGGEAGPAALDAVAFTLEGTARARYQSSRPEPPYLEVRVTLDVEAAPGQRWARVTAATTFPEGTFGQGRLLGPAGGGAVDLDSGRVTAAPVAWEDFARDFRRSPQLVIRDAWERRAHLRWLGSATIDGAPCDLVTFPYFGATGLTVAIDAEGRVLRHELLFDDLLQGDALVTAHFLDYRREDGRWLPGRFRQVEAGVAAVEGRFTRMEVGGERDAGAFAVPEPPAAAEGAGGAAPPAAAPPSGAGEQPVRLAEGVHLVRGLGGADYHSLLVDLGSSFAVVEAPLGAAAAREVLEAARALDPAKPIRHVVPTHHHDDHAGGVPHLVWLLGREGGPGTRVVTTPGNAAFFREATAARRTLAGPAVAPDRPAELVLVGDGEWQLRGERTLRILDVGPTDHAAEMLVAWLPEAGVLFQGDLIRFPEDGPLEPARPQARQLLELLEARGLEPRIVAGVHGRAGTLEELRRAVAAASKAGAEGGD